MFFRRFSKPMPFLEYFKSQPSVVFYDDNEEYRACIRKAFRFNPDEKYTYDGKLVDFTQLDRESQDEVFFDSQSMAEGMNILYEKTHTDPFFQELYLHAAGRMFSDSPKIGQAVLCSYDTFSWYYTCVWYFLNGGFSSVAACQEYRKLKTHFDIE